MGLRGADGLGAIGATGLAWLILPRDSVKYWTETLRETGRIGGEEYALNQSLNGLLYRLGLRTKTSEGVAQLWVTAQPMVAVWVARLERPEDGRRYAWRTWRAWCTAVVGVGYLGLSLWRS